MIYFYIIDISNPNWENQKNSVNKVLEQLRLLIKPIILVYNKSGFVARNTNNAERQENCFISTKTGEGIEQLKNLIKDHFLDK